MKNIFGLLLLLSIGDIETKSFDYGDIEFSTEIAGETIVEIAKSLAPFIDITCNNQKECAGALRQLEELEKCNELTSALQLVRQALNSNAKIVPSFILQQALIDFGSITEKYAGKYALKQESDNQEMSFYGMQYLGSLMESSFY